MNRVVGWITFGVFLLFLAGGAVGLVSLSTSTGVQMGGSATQTGVATLTTPLQVQAGWIRNNSPWPVKISAITVDGSGAKSAPLIYLGDSNTDPIPAAGVAPAWAKTPVSLPYTLKGGALRYFGFSILPASGQVASFHTISVTFTGPLPFTYTSNYTGVAVAASAGDLPPEYLATDPSVDNQSLARYLPILRAALASGDLPQIQSAMGDGTTAAAAQAMKTSQAGFAAAMPVQVTAVTKDSRAWSVQFYSTAATKDGLPKLSVTWKNFRWSATVAPVAPVAKK